MQIISIFWISRFGQYLIEISIYVSMSPNCTTGDAFHHPREIRILSECSWHIGLSRRPTHSQINLYFRFPLISAARCFVMHCPYCFCSPVTEEPRITIAPPTTRRTPNFYLQHDLVKSLDSFQQCFATKLPVAIKYIFFLLYVQLASSSVVFFDFFH